MRIIIALLLLIASQLAVAQASSPQSSCDRPNLLRKSSASASSVASASASTSQGSRVSQDVVIYCGASTTSTSASSPTEATRGNESRGIDWARLLEALAKVIASIAWPLAVYFIARHFRAELAALLARLKKVKAGSAEAEFERGVDEASQGADIPPTGPEPDVETPSVSAAIADPRGTILGAWLEVEKAVFRLCKVKGLDISVRGRPGVLAAMKAIQSANALDQNYVGLFHDLRSLRNAAAHNYEFNPEPEAVLHYAKLASALTSAINDAANAA